MQKKILKNYTSKSFWNNKSVLITGINGFIGGNLSKHLSNLGANIIGITNNKIKNKFLEFEKLDKSIKISQINLQNYNDINKFVQSNKVDVCIHLAAQVDVNIAKTDPLLTFQSNIAGTFNLLESLRKKNKTKAIIVASSDKAYGSYALSKLPYKETYDLRPIYPYDVSKSASDLISQSYSITYGLSVGILRCANLYGPGDFNLKRIIPETIINTFKNKKLKIRSNGKLTRDYLYVEDAADAYNLVMKKLTNSNKNKLLIYNVSSNFNSNVVNLVKKIQLQMKGKINYYIANSSKKEIKNQKLNFSKISKELGWKPKTNLDVGLSKTIDWYQQNIKLLK